MTCNESLVIIDSGISSMMVELNPNCDDSTTLEEMMSMVWIGVSYMRYIGRPLHGLIGAVRERAETGECDYNERDPRKDVYVH